MMTAGTGNLSIVAGNGTPGFSGDGGAATSAQLNEPSGIAVDSAGNLYNSDANTSVVRKVSAGTGLIATIAGIPGRLGAPG
jgi:trimeric autotransporter adhesin